MVAKEAGRIAGVQNEDPSILSQEDSESSKAKVQIKGSTLKENHVLMGLMGGVRGIGLWPRHCPWLGRAEQRGQGSEDGRTLGCCRGTTEKRDCHKKTTQL